MSGIINSAGSKSGVIGYTELSSTEWTDYYSSSTITGWGSVSNPILCYRRIGTLIYINFYLSGVSNHTNAEFTLPYANKSTPVGNYVVPNFGECQDNGSQLLHGGGSGNIDGYLAPSGSSVICRIGKSASGWTNSGDKRITGFFIYEANSV